MNTILKNELRQFSYDDPEEKLKLFGFFHAFSTVIPGGDKLRDWRHHKLENYRESEQAALFAYGLKAAGLKPSIRYAHFPKKDRDFDAAIRWGNPGAFEFATVQLKEVVRSELSLTANLETQIEGFRDYSGSEDLIAAIFVNRDLALDLKALKIPSLKLRELWIFGVSGSSNVQYHLFGDFLKQPHHYSLPMPELR